MISESKLQDQYAGFLETKLLNFEEGDFPYRNFILENSPQELPRYFVMPDSIRLGQRMEVFMSAALSQDRYLIKAQNIQIIAEKKTLGELDFIIEDKLQDEFIHIEMIYKFYFYRPEIEGNWIAKLIGPNAGDKLSYKLNKLSSHQFPMLYNKETEAYLRKLGLSAENIKQQISFKAQIFTPFNYQFSKTENHLKNLEKGHFFNSDELKMLNIPDTLFFIPPKNDWVSAPSVELIHLKFEDFYKKISAALLEQRSYMFWIKDCNNAPQKHFATWW